MLEEFQSMSDGQLGSINMVRNRLELESPKTWPVYSVPYRAGLKAREFEKYEISKMLKMDVIEPETTKWPSKIVLESSQ